jgi:hypothetical protein
MTITGFSLRRIMRLPVKSDAVTPTVFPRSGWAGAGICAVGWITAWLPSHPLSAASFVLLWVGLIFTVDGLVYLRRGTSPAHAQPWKFAQMFAFSVPCWWLFEAFNARVQNWHYLLDRPYGFTWNAVSYNVMATLCFSTVLPAVMEMTALITTLAPLRPRLTHDDPEPRVPRAIRAGVFLTGLVALAAPLLWPHYFFGLIWLGPLLALDAVNATLGRRSTVGHLRAGDMRFVAALALAALCCGGFWEMWNYWSLPKWQYTIPFVGFAKIFEMPVLGYLGYLPFGVELFALYQFLLWLTRQRADALPF